MTDSSAWHDDSKFWLQCEPVFFNAQRIDAAPSEVADIIGLVALKERACVLDLPCGVGRHALEFARRGYQTTGVDLSQPYLQRARKEAGDRKLPLEFIKEDMRSFHRDGAFELVINLFSSFGYFEDPDDDNNVLENIFRSLLPGGRVVFDMFGKEILARDFHQHDTYEVSGITVVEEREILSNWTQIETRWTLIKNEETYERTMSLRIYSAAEFKTMLLSCGFTEIEIYGDLKGAPYDDKAKRLVSVAKKP